jgi:O-acetylhomoserine (thiol)-lyase
MPWRNLSRGIRLLLGYLELIRSGTEPSSSTLEASARWTGRNQQAVADHSVFDFDSEVIERMKLETIAIHAGYDGDPTTKAVAVPIYQTVAFEFDDAAHGAALFNLDVQGNIYTRIGNPTNTILEKRVAALEGGVEALSVSSGMAAIHYSLINIAELGNNIVSLPQLYGATYTLLAHILPKQGIAGRFAESDHPDAVEKLIDENTRAVFCESVGNPAGNVADIEGLARVAHKHGVPLIVDNTVATPILLRPIEYGADVVVHSMTKFMGGHGTTLGGMIVDSGKFPWRDHPERFYMLNKPEIAYHGVVYTEHYGAAAYVARCRTVAQRNTGSTLSPFNGFLLLQGIETMALRVERHVENARSVAQFLRNHTRVAWVNYAGFPDSPLYPMAQRYLGSRSCSLLTFGVKGGFEQGVKCFDALELFKRMVNMGDAKSLACHPASTTHRQLTPEEQLKAGVTPEMIRLSVGIEHIDDIIADLAQALDKATD